MANKKITIEVEGKEKLDDLIAQLRELKKLLAELKEPVETKLPSNIKIEINVKSHNFNELNASSTKESKES